MFAFTGTTTILRTTFLSPSIPHVTSRTRKNQITTVPNYGKRRQSVRAQLIGIPDELRGSSNPSPQEVLLAELRFSDPSRLPALVESSLEYLDEDFYNFIEKTINESADLEERENLRALRDAITSIMSTMLEEIAKREKEQQQKAQTTTIEKTEEEAAEDKAQQSYDELIDMMLDKYDEEDTSSVKTAVGLNYHRIDLQFLERLSERIVSSGIESPKYASLRDIINQEMNVRVSEAMESLRFVLSSGPLDEMKRSVNMLLDQGRIDDAFILLLQANIQEAKKARATDAYKALSELFEFTTQQKDASVKPEIRLIRKLLRTDDEEVRNVLLTESFEAGTPVALPDGSSSIGTKVSGKDFVKALRKLIEEFGNVDEDFILKLSKIGEESEAVARKIFDMEGKDVEDLQYEAFHKRSVSVWDLEEFEHQETGEGRVAPWEGKLGDIPDKMGFDNEGKLSV